MINYTLKNIRAWIQNSDYLRGRNYYNRGLVKSVTWVDKKLLGIVNGSRQYKQVIEFFDGKIDARCSCPVAYDCKHVAAVLLKGLESVELSAQPIQNIFINSAGQVTVGNPLFGQSKFLPPLKIVNQASGHNQASSKEISLSYKAQEWLNNLQKHLQQKKAKEQNPKIDKEILYLFSIDKDEKALMVDSVTVTLKKNGSRSDNYKQYSPRNVVVTSTPAKFLKDEDVIILRDIAYNATLPYSSESKKLEGDRGKKILQQILETKRCYWQKPLGEPIKFAKSRRGKISWDIDVNGDQKIIINCKDKIDNFFVLDCLYYTDLTNNCFGLLEVNLENNIAKLIAKCPPIKENEAFKIRSYIEENFNQKLGTKIALPALIEDVEAKKITPIICLKLYNLTIKEQYYYNQTDGITIPVADLYFKYHQTEISAQDYSPTIIYQENDKIIKIARDFNCEKNTKNILIKNNFRTIKDLPHKYYFYKDPKSKGSSMPYIFLDNCDTQSVLNSSITYEWVRFLTKTIPDLKKQGWQIDQDDDFLIDVISADEDWYSDINQSGNIDWFNIDIGIYINNQKISLIPILINLLKTRQNIFAEIKEMDDSKDLYVKIESGKILQLPIGRIRDIILFLYNFLDAEYNNEGIKISRFSASFIADLAASELATRLRFFGGEKMIEMGKKLKDFKNIKEINPPQNFAAKLRNYQQEGLNWLQFLKEYNLAGVLADDMGLGKTIQALAYIAYEKENNQLNQPILIIAPTSVVFNWKAEINKIVPHLKTLTLHGINRKNQFSDLAEFDIILTSYPLLRIDQELLLSIAYHTVILDEAQYIKNSKAKVTLIANQIKAQNRLCLTGTPMENHLGELWSIFNFLMPGYLGQEKMFNNIFRTPIEKYGNQEQKNILAKRVKPFLLRRTKEKILPELPLKTEIIHHIELSSAQRDIYETIRALTFKEVQAEIEKKGFNRSQIKILEALLRLRQICCDPRISNLKNVKTVNSSAKLKHLIELLPNLVEQGRAILLFSQFVSMLNLIEEECQKLGIKYVKLTGDTKDREMPIKQFQSGEVPLFLISLKAGGVGLNLTKADTVIHYDPWWNPAVENQATDRAYRIGQQKPVFVYKLITTNTVEEKILTMQIKKKDLADKLFDPENKGNSKITIEDLQDIFTPIEIKKGEA
jgi:SNF2 family DNA or RNA helicase